MGFLDKVKGMIIEEEPAVEAAPAQPATLDKVAVRPTSQLNQDMVAAIRKETFSRNTVLTALMTAATELADIIPDSTMRLKAAQKTAGGGRSGKDIADAVAIHLNDVDNAELKFGQALSAKVQAEVGGLTRQADALEQSAADSQRQVQALTQKLQELQATIGEQAKQAASLRSQAQVKEAELRQAELEFKAAAQTVRAELNDHKSTILSTLG